MSLQSDLESAKAIVISAPEDYRFANFLGEQLSQRIREIQWSTDVEDTNNKYLDTIAAITGADNEIVIVVLGHNSEQLIAILRSVGTRTKHLIGVLIGDVLSDVLKVIPTLNREYIIDFSNANLWGEQIKVLNNLVDRLIYQDNNSIDKDEPQNLPPGTVSLTLTGDNGDRGATYTVTTEVAMLLLTSRQLQAAANDSSGPEVEFTSLLRACAQTDTRLSRWFRNFIDRSKPTIPGVTVGINAQRNTAQEVENKAVSIFASTSVRQIFSTAERLVPDEIIDAQNLMAAFIYYPVGHESQYKEWNLDRRAWSLSFLGYMQRFHSDELQQVSNEHRDIFSEVPIPDVRDNPIGDIGSGPSTHITPDMWTTEDELNYRPYAYAIARFLTHPRTAAPLSISIQAPWGGGKTSLMRMIQKELDAPATQPKKSEPVPPKSLHMKVRDVLREIEKKLHPSQPATDTIPNTEREEKQFSAPPQTPPVKPGDTKEPIEPKMTVWFNVWKYENINQVWAGLVDTILRQVTERMTPYEREKFWLQLTFKRIDADTIRQAIHDRILRYMWQYSRKILFWAGGVFIASLILMLVSWTGGIAVMSGTLISTLVLVWLKYKKASNDVKEEPADISLREYVSAPDYTAELGFVHYAETDFRKLLACIPERYKPLVIFIDDLDRCSPGRVAQVMEAINLFLAGEFPDCMFVLGMDSEMVAAALQSAHSDVIRHLPLDASIPVGWRFMEKFIQLPFIIPPCGTMNVRRYTASLFVEKKKEPDPLVVSTTQEVVADLPAIGYRADEVRRLSKERGLTTEQTEQVVEHVRMQTALHTIDRGIREFADKYEQVQSFIEAEASVFRGNPRDLKRFVNTFRFHYFLWWAQKAAVSRESDVASLEQVIRWTAFSIRWPEVARWLWRGSTSYRQENEMDGSSDGRKTASRMRQLEDTCLDLKDSRQWEEAMKKTVFPGTAEESGKDLHWLHDAELYSFLKREMGRAESERLSAAVGKGLW